MDAAPSAETNPRPATYDAFATYATDPDRNLVRNVETFVESLHRDRLLPKEFRAPLGICVDGHDFRIPRPEPGSQLTLEELMRKVVRAYQESSRCLLVFSGEETIAHRWINDEIDWWRQQASPGPIYFVLTHGQLEVSTNGVVIVEKALPRALADDQGGVSPVWFDLRGYYYNSSWYRPFQSARERKVQRESRAWIKVRDYEEERFRLAAHILSIKYAQTLSSEDLIPKWQAAFRVKRRIRRALLGVSIVGLVIMAAVADRLLQAQEIDAGILATQAAINDQRYEEAIRIALRGLPVDGDFFWRYHWSAPNVRKLLATLAGAAQLSAFGGQFKTDEKAPIQSVAFDPSGTKIVAASQAGTVTVWDSRKRSEPIICRQDDAFHGNQRSHYDGSVNWVRDSRFGESAGTVLSVGSYGAWIWNPNCSTCASGNDNNHCPSTIRMIGHTKDVRTGSFSPDWKIVLTTSDDGTARTWDAHDGKELGRLQLPRSHLTEDYSYTTDAEYSRDGKWIVVSRRDGLIAIVDSTSGQTKKVLRPSGPAVWSVHFDREGKRVLSTSADGEIAIWNLSSDSRIVFPRQASGVGKASFSPDERFVVATSLDGAARIWDTTTLTQVIALKGHAGPVLSAQFSPDGKQVVTSSDDQTARIWNIGTDVIPFRVRTSSYPIESSAMSADGRKLVVGTFDGQVIIYELDDQNVLREISELNPNVGSITSVSFGMDSKTVAFSSDRGSAIMWFSDSDTTRLLTTLPARRSFVATEIKGSLVATASFAGDGQAHGEVLNLRTGSSSWLEGASLVTSLEFDRSGTKIAAASEASFAGKRLAYVWDAETGKTILKLEHDSPVLSAHFSKDGWHLATSSLDYKARVWDLRSGRPTQVFVGHTYDVNSARLSPDGARLVTASSDRTARVWDVQTGAMILQFAVGSEANDAFFTQDGNRILVTTAGGEVLIYDVSWTATIDRSLKARACGEKLPQRDKDDRCFRIGPFSAEFWRRAVQKTEMRWQHLWAGYIGL
jgi:WD40 repeat protein